MKVVKYPIIILLYIFSMYFILNWFVWNWPFAGKEVGLLFISGLLFFTGLGLLFKNRKSKEKSFVILLSFIVVIFVSRFLYQTSVQIGYKQVENDLRVIKSKIEQYHIDKGYYPKKLIDLKKENYLNNFKKPIFLCSFGRYNYSFKGNNNYAGPAIESEYGEIYMYIEKDNSITIGDY